MTQGLSGANAKINRGGYELAAEARWVGADLLVCIWGGQAPHIGAVAMATPRPSLADPQQTSATASVFTYVGHKEDRLAQEAAEALSASLNCRVVVTAGCHWDGLDPQGITQVRRNGRELVALLRERLLEQRER
ncbi:MAG: hypothetical protein C4525_14195 [Desulfarculus sp.]|nr:MAG: hypothetical protein C4525_14195 [Desulfarculus sp.]